MTSPCTNKRNDKHKPAAAREPMDATNEFSTSRMGRNTSTERRNKKLKRWYKSVEEK